MRACKCAFKPNLLSDNLINIEKKVSIILKQMEEGFKVDTTKQRDLNKSYNERTDFLVL